MMNYFDLMELLENKIDYETYNKISNDFTDDFLTEYNNLKFCNSVRKRAIEKYVSSATYKDEKTATYTNGATVLILSQSVETKNELKEINLSDRIFETWKTKKPTDFNIFDSIALYKTLKKQNNQDYFFHIGNYYYNADYVTKMIYCIANKENEHIHFEISENGELTITQSSGYGAIVLPVKMKNCYVSINASFKDYCDYRNNIEKTLMDNMSKTA